MEYIKKAKSISIWIFILPFVAVNTCLILVTQFHSLFPNQVDIIHNTFPYFDGGASISRTARPYPSWLVFKPLMIFTSFLLVRYWMYNREIVNFFSKDHKNMKKIFFFGVASAIFLTLHSIFLGIKFDNDLYKLFRRVILLLFIIFEIVAQAYLVSTLYSLKKDISQFLNLNVLKIKIVLVTILIVVATISIPIISLPGDDFMGITLKFLKHGLEWNYFLVLLFFYYLSFLMWKKIKA